MHNLAPLPIIPIQNIPITKVWSGFQSDKTEWSATGSILERNPIDLPYLDAFFWSGIPILNKTPHFHLYQISKHCIQIHMNTNHQYILKKLPWNSLHLLFSYWIRYKLYPIPLVSATSSRLWFKPCPIPLLERWLACFAIRSHLHLQLDRDPWMHRHWHLVLVWSGSCHLILSPMFMYEYCIVWYVLYCTDCSVYWKFCAR